MIILGAIIVWYFLGLLGSHILTLIPSRDFYSYEFSWERDDDFLFSYALFGPIAVLSAVSILSYRLFRKYVE